jgi:hypothetical protein
MTTAREGLPVSVQMRLVQHVKATGIDPNARTHDMQPNGSSVRSNH